MTDAEISQLTIDSGKTHAVRVAKGLTLHLTGGGQRVWRFRCRVRGEQQSVTIGKWPAIGAAEARRESERLLAMADRGHSPMEDYRRRRFGRGTAGNPTVREFGERWMREVVEKVRKDPVAVRRWLEREVYPALGRKRIAHIKPLEVQRLIFAKRDAGRPQAAAALRHTLRRMFEYARACAMIAVNPTDQTPRKFVAKRVARSRSLSEAELRGFLRVVRSPRAGRMGIALELLLLTLARKGELRNCRWEHIDFERAIWELPAELSKTGTPHIVYLSDRALSLFRRLREMSGRATVVLPARDAIHTPISEAALNKFVHGTKWGFPAFTPHDLRRTASTILNERGFSADVVEKALNHNMRGVRGVYNRAQYAEQRKQMLQEWADWLDGLGA